MQTVTCEIFHTSQDVSVKSVDLVFEPRCLEIKLSASGVWEDTIISPSKKIQSGLQSHPDII
jgi:hypothetical protein